MAEDTGTDSGTNTALVVIIVVLIAVLLGVLFFWRGGGGEDADLEVDVQEQTGHLAPQPGVPPLGGVRVVV